MLDYFAGRFTLYEVMPMRIFGNGISVYSKFTCNGTFTKFFFDGVAFSLFRGEEQEAGDEHDAEAHRN
jgi:hypothetical protein